MQTARTGTSYLSNRVADVSLAYFREFLARESYAKPPARLTERSNRASTRQPTAAQSNRRT